jgi:hypothetical protein
MSGWCSTRGEEGNAYRLLVGKPEGNRPLGRPRRRWVDNIRMDLGEVGWRDVDWSDLAPGYRTEVYCASCEVRTEFIYVM